jgi:hypothetical protein
VFEGFGLDHLSEDHYKEVFRPEIEFHSSPSPSTRRPDRSPGNPPQCRSSW